LEAVVAISGQLDGSLLVEALTIDLTEDWLVVARFVYTERHMEGDHDDVDVRTLQLCSPYCLHTVDID